MRKALASAMPADRKVPERALPKLAAAIPFIDAILEDGRKAPRKQQHMAHRIGCDCAARDLKWRQQDRRFVSMCAPGARESANG